MRRRWWISACLLRTWGRPSLGETLFRARLRLVCGHSAAKRKGLRAVGNSDHSGLDSQQAIRGGANGGGQSWAHGGRSTWVIYTDARASESNACIGG